jgi:hypothetical protein
MIGAIHEQGAKSPVPQAQRGRYPRWTGTDHNDLMFLHVSSP